MLDIARAIAEKDSVHTMEKVDILLALAESSLEREDIEASTSYYLKALSILERLAEPDSRQIATPYLLILTSVSPSTRQMAQWETAGLEAESCLSKETTLLIQLSYGHTTEKYYFLRMWNSEVGESFRNLNKSGAEISACQSPFSQASSTKNGSVFGTTTEYVTLQQIIHN
ncbi:hypothetical protein ACET3Z_024695 [Daucus carota]